MLDGFMTGFPARRVSGGVAGMLAALRRHRASLGSVLDGISASVPPQQQQVSVTEEDEQQQQQQQQEKQQQWQPESWVGRDSPSAGRESLLSSNLLILKIENVTLLDRLSSQRQVEGTLCITATHLIFIDATCSKECWVPHCHVQSVEKLQPVSYGVPLRIRCKTFRVLTLVIPRERDCADIILAVGKLAQPERIEDLMAFAYKHPDASIHKSFGWRLFDLRSDFQRMGVPNENWVLTDLNANYELCDTYPSVIFVPSTATTPILLGSSRFRSRCRLPALSYIHKKNQAALCRCSQPLAGFSARCSEDELMLQAILRANRLSDALVVVDTRPKINALANRAAGKGYENDRVYTNIKFHFVGIENVHVMRNSLSKLVDCSDAGSVTSASFLSGLEASGWLKHIRAILETSVFIARNLESNNSVLVHCSDGWDRTAQTCSLAAILLDPYYRTIDGFQALIEKEWLAFGHKFTDRCRLIASVDAKEESPIFSQFLEAVWQLTSQFPRSFQFNECFLIELHSCVFSCQYGTFIGNCEKDRMDLRLPERTCSLWAHFASNVDHYTNPFYSPGSPEQDPVLRPNVGPQCFRYWKGMYNRYDSAVHERESLVAIGSALRDQNAVLESHIRFLEKRVQELAQAIGRPLVSSLSRKLQGLLSAESILCLASLAVDNDDDDGGSGSKVERGAAATTTSAAKLLLQQPRLLSEQQQLAAVATSRNVDLGEVNLASYRSTAAAAGGDDDDDESGFEDGISPQLSRSQLLDADGRPVSGLRAPMGPLKRPHHSSTSGGVADASTRDLASNDVGDVALSWSSLRDHQQCRGCSSPYEYTSTKRHCRSCGLVFCGRCTESRAPLAGLGPQSGAAPVCKPCHKRKSAATAATAPRPNTAACGGQTADGSEDSR